MPSSGSRSKEIRKLLLKQNNLIVIGIIISVLLAASISVPLRRQNLTTKTIFSISMPGKIFMNLLKMLILPLLVLSLLSGLTSVNISTSGKFGLYTVMYYSLTTFLSVCLGMFLVAMIRPGKMSIKMDLEQANKVIDPLESVLDLFNNFFPDNIIRSTFQQAEIHFINKSTKILSDTGDEKNYTIQFKQIVTTSFVHNPNFLGLIFFSIFTGVVINKMGSEADLLVKLINILNNLTIKMVEALLLTIPIGIFFLVLGNLLEVDDMEAILKTIGWFALTVYTGLFIHMFMTLPLIYLVFTRKNPYVFMWGMSRAMLVALFTDSSSAALPVTMSCAEQNNRIDPRITKFMFPIGAIINMDGTGLYEAVAAIFIAQINGISLSFLDMVRISFTSTLAAVGGSSVPSAGFVTLLIALSTAGLPTHQVTILYACDWFLDRSRTAVNILGDSFGGGVMQILCKKNLEIPLNTEDIELEKGQLVLEGLEI